MRRWLVCLLLTLLGGVSTARAVTPRFDAVSDADSLRDNIVTSLTRDPQGLLWLGTANGLVRYDGHEFKRYGVPAAAPDLGSEQFVRAVLADRASGIWVGMGATGLGRWEPQTGHWTRWHPQDEEASDRAPLSGSIRALAQTPDGVLWVGSPAGLDRLDPQSGRFTHFRPEPGGLPDRRVQALWVDQRGRLWVGTAKGLARLQAGRLLAVPLPQPASITLIGEDSAGRLVLGSAQGGLWRLPHDEGRIDTVEAEGQASSPGSYFAMAQPHPDEIWLGTAAALERRRAADLSLIERVTSEGGQHRVAPRSEVRSLLLDPAGIVWVGTYAQGLLRHLPPLPGLSTLHREPAEWFRQGEWDVRSVLQRRNGEVWLGTQSQGIEILDAQLQGIDARRPGPGLPPGRVGALVELDDGTVWAGVDTRLVRFDAQGRWRETLPPLAGAVRRLQADPDGGLWVATAEGLWRLVPHERQPRPVASDETVLDLNAFVRLADGSLWVGGSTGLYRVTQAGEARLERRFGKNVVGLAADGERGLWVDTTAGLHRVQVTDGPALKVERVLSGDAGETEASFGANLLVDAQGRLWSHRGVYDPHTGAHHTLGPSDGVDFGTGWFRAFAALADGRLLFGGSQGLLVIEPAAFKPWTYLPPVALTSLHVAGRERPLPSNGGRLELVPGERSLFVGFAALDYSQPGRTRFRHRLLGQDDAWVEVGADARLASYTNLAPGHYRFEVQGSNRNGAWSPHNFALELQVLPQWWQTWWAGVLGVLLGFSLLLGVNRTWIRLRTRRLRRRQRELEQHVEERTQALVQATRALDLKSRQLEEISVTDALTGMRNRRFLEQHMPADVALAVRRHEDHPPGSAHPATEDLVFFMVDVDHFKRVNDTHGHAAGDQVLRGMRERLEQVLRASDYAVRWGGEEFLFVARGLPRADAAELAHRACHAVAAKPFVLGDGLTLNLSCSIGFASFPLAPQWPKVLSWQQVVDLADAALYEAKHRGRDGWFGLVAARADSPEQLRRDAAGGLAAWQASGRLDRAARGE